MKPLEDGAGADERLGETLPIKPVPAVRHDVPSPDAYHVGGADVDSAGGGVPEVSAPLFADPVTLRPVRRTGGIRAPRPYVAPTPAVPETVQDVIIDNPYVPPGPHAPMRPAYGSGRPLPRIGTEALGRCARLARFGAFIDFSGHRGLIHISQLRPGVRVERVEDVIAIGDEVVVRVIAVDPQLRHVNLAYVGPAPHSVNLDQRPVATTTAAEATRAEVVSSTTPMLSLADGTLTPAHATDARGPTPAHATPEARLPTSPDAAVPDPIVSAESASVVQTPIRTPTPRNDSEPEHAIAISPTAPHAVGTQSAQTSAVGANVTPARPVPVPTQPPATPRRREIVGYVPGARVRPEASSAPTTSSTTGARPTTRPPTPPKPQEVARTGSRAMRRELDDPNHPMARFLAMLPDLGEPTRAARPATHPLVRSAPINPEPDIAPEPPRMVPATRLVHADEPDPEPPVSDTPPTIDALTARFNPKPGAPTRAPRLSPTSRSQAAREAQARMLEQLRQ